jgi:hypothetical protein
LLRGLEKERAEFAGLVERNPELFGPAMLEHLRELAGNERALPFVRMFIDFVEQAASDPATAWHNWEKALEAGEARGREMAPDVEQVSRLIEDGQYGDAITQGEDLLELAIELGQGVLVSELHSQLATAYRLMSSGDRGENIDKAIDHTNGAVAATMDPAHRLRQQMNLAVLVAMRRNGDPAENFEASIGILGDALAGADESTPGDLRPPWDHEIRSAEPQLGINAVPDSSGP